MDKRRNDNKGEKALALYSSGLSLAKIAEKIGGTRQSIYDLLIRREGYRPRKMKPADFQIFNGRKYSRRNNGYYLATSDPRTLMHRDIWIFHNGAIKKGYDIHHKDKNRSHNKIENLELLEKSEHSRRFATGRNQYSRKGKR